MKKVIFVTCTTLAIVAFAQTTEDKIAQLLSQGKVKDARYELDHSKATGTDLARQKGLVFHAEYKVDSAFAYLDVVRKAGDNSPRFQLPYAEVLMWKKNVDAAYDVLKGLKIDLGADPRAWSAMERKAELLSWMGKFKDAEKFYTLIVKDTNTIQPVKLRCRTKRAEVIAWNKDFPRALAELDSVLVALPGDEPASLIKGQVQEWQGNYPAAKSAYSAGLQLHPESAQLRLRLEKLAWVK